MGGRGEMTLLRDGSSHVAFLYTTEVGRRRGGGKNLANP